KTTVYLAGHCRSCYPVGRISFCPYTLPIGCQPAETGGRRGTAARARETIGSCTGDTRRRGGGAYTSGQGLARWIGQYVVVSEIQFTAGAGRSCGIGNH